MLSFIVCRFYHSAKKNCRDADQRPISQYHALYLSVRYVERNTAMWMVASEIPVRLEILDQSGLRLFDTSARLKHLDDTFALVTCDEPQSRSGLHWGAPVRFELEDGMRRYEITGRS